MKVEIIPGILTHTTEEYTTRLEMVEQSDATWVHIDIADGQFVPNITVMPHEIMSFTTRLKLEAHLMTFRPERYFSDLTVAGFSRVLLHREAYKDLEECTTALKQASDYFSEVGMVVNPDTEIEDYSGVPVQVIQCMSVQPGMSGQPFLDKVYANLEKIKSQKLSVVLAADGGVSEENIKQLQEAGATRFVINSRLFVANTVAQNLQYFNQLVTGGI